MIIEILVVVVLVLLLILISGGENISENKNVKILKTWAGKSNFSYTGSVCDGTTITYGSGFSTRISSSQYTALLNNFRGRIVNIGTSRDNPPRGSVGAWLQANVTKTAMASYVGPILIAEDYAEWIGGSEIAFKERYPSETKS